MGDLGHVPGAEDAELDRTAIHQRADLRSPQGGDPVEPLLAFQVFLEAVMADQSAIAHKHHLLNAKALPDLFHLSYQAQRVGAVAFEHLHRH